LQTGLFFARLAKKQKNTLKRGLQKFDHWKTQPKFQQQVFGSLAMICQNLVM